MKYPLTHQFTYLLVVFMATVLRKLPSQIRGWAGAALGQLVYFIGIRRKVTAQNFSDSFPELPKKAVTAVSRAAYCHFGRVAVEFAAIPELSLEKDVNRILDPDHHVLEEALAAGQGSIVFSGHLGNWELMGAMAAKRGLPVSFVVTTQRNKLIEEFIDQVRRNCGIEIIKRRDAARGVLKALKRNRAVAILIDQDAHDNGAFAPFFGRPASTPRGAAVFHLRTGAPLVFAYSTWLPGNRYRIYHERFESNGITDPDILTALMSQRLETAIRTTPEQWMWMHKRWKSTPPIV